MGCRLAWNSRVELAQYNLGMRFGMVSRYKRWRADMYMRVGTEACRGEDEVTNTTIYAHCPENAVDLKQILTGKFRSQPSYMETFKERV